MKIMTINSDVASITAMAIFLAGFIFGVCLGYNTGVQRTMEQPKESMIKEDSIMIKEDSIAHTDTVKENMDRVRNYIVLRTLIKGL